MNMHVYTITFIGHITRIDFPSDATECGIQLDSDNNVNKTYIDFHMNGSNPLWILEYLSREQFDGFMMEALHIQKCID